MQPTHRGEWQHSADASDAGKPGDHDARASATQASAYQTLLASQPDDRVCPKLVRQRTSTGRRWPFCILPSVCLFNVRLMVRRLCRLTVTHPQCRFAHSARSRAAPLVGLGVAWSGQSGRRYWRLPRAPRHSPELPQS